MSWTAPKTFTANTVLTAADLNTYLRDNLNETAPAKCTSSGSWFIGAGPNAIQERIPQFSLVTASETTSSTSYANLETVGPSVTVTSGSRCLIIISASIANGLVNTQSFIGYEITGTTTQAITDTLSLTTDGVTEDKVHRRCQILMEENMNPGVNTFTLKYKTTANTSTFSERFLAVLPF